MIIRIIAVILLLFSLTLPTAVQAAAPRILITSEGQGPDVILIPGLSSSPKVWDASVKALRGKYRIHRVQLSGFGGAPVAGNVSGPILDGVVAELHAYVAAKKLKKPAFVGHSMGGFLSLMMALRHPEDTGKVMIVDSLPFAGLLFGAPDVASVKDGAARFRDQIAGQDQANFAASQERNLMSLVKSDADRPWLAAMCGASDPKTVAQVFYEVTVSDLRGELTKLNVPTTLLYPTNTFMTSDRANAVYLPAYAGAKDVKLIAIPDSYHFIMQDQPTVFAAQLKAFLAQK
jgi:pimeloyl-ACP methyl ester carboxylesterase